MYQAILSSTHTPLTGVSTPHLYWCTPMVLLLLPPFSFLGGPMPLLISGGNLLMLISYDLGSLRALQESSVLHYHLVLESLYVLQLLLLLCNSLLFGLFLGFGLCLSPGFLSHTLCIMGLHCLLQTKKGLLLLLMPLLYFIALLLKHFSIILRNVREGKRRHNDIETRAKTSFFIYILLT